MTDRWREKAYRGESNGLLGGQVHRAAVWFREFKMDQELAGLPPWWLCLGVTDPARAGGIPGFQPEFTISPGGHEFNLDAALLFFKKHL